MDTHRNQAHTAKSVNQTSIRRHIVDWSEDTVVVNGHPITVVFPDETKILEDE